MKCKDCNLKEFEGRSGQSGRYYCKHENARKAFNSSGCYPALICRTGRRDRELTIKTAPRWCPLKKAE